MEQYTLPRSNPCCWPKATTKCFIPGEVEDRSSARLQREGIELPAGTLADLERLAEQAGLPLELADA